VTKVVFLALGATRKGAVIAEAGQVVADGGTATVLIRKSGSWEDHPLPDGVEVVDLGALQRRRPAWVRIPLYRVPRLLLRVCLPGPLSGRRERFDNAYRRRIARPIDRRLARFYRRDPAEVLRRAVLAGAPADLVVVTDAQSLAPAAELASNGSGNRLDMAFYAPGSGVPG
jgi:hypothetical protein